LRPSDAGVSEDLPHTMPRGQGKIKARVALIVLYVAI
jgi:hypothetical protein